MQDNIEAILTQSYPNFRSIIVTDSEEDAAHSIAKAAMARHPNADAHLHIAKSYGNASGKIAALLTALDGDGWASEAYAFVDSDAFTPARWLRDIVDPLVDTSVGATTGFRWYFPTSGGFWSHAATAWNASGSNLMFDERYNFPWGGAMAALTETLKKIDIRTIWGNSVSDDLSLNAALRGHNYRTLFLPQCTVVTRTRTTRPEFFNWAARQIVLTRAFNRKLWNYGFAAYTFLSTTATLGIACLICGWVLSLPWLLPAALLLAPSILGVFRSSQRITTFKRVLPEFAGDFEKNRWADSIASLIVPWVMTYCIIKSARVREIDWRGRRYKLTGQTPLASTRSIP